MKQCLLQNGKKKIWYKLEKLLDTKLSFAKKSKTIDEVSYLSSFVIRSSAELFLFSIQVKSTSLYEIRQNPGFL